jgi:hypothetical protein
MPLPSQVTIIVSHPYEDFKSFIQLMIVTGAEDYDAL